MSGWSGLPKWANAVCCRYIRLITDRFAIVVRWFSTNLGGLSFPFLLVLPFPSFGPFLPLPPGFPVLLLPLVPFFLFGLALSFSPSLLLSFSSVLLFSFLFPSFAVSFPSFLLPPPRCCDFLFCSIQSIKLKNFCSWPSWWSWRDQDPLPGLLWGMSLDLWLDLPVWTRPMDLGHLYLHLGNIQATFHGANKDRVPLLHLKLPFLNSLWWFLRDNQVCPDNLCGLISTQCYCCSFMATTQGSYDNTSTCSSRMRDGWNDASISSTSSIMEPTNSGMAKTLSV